MMDGVSEDLAILYRAVSRRQGRVDYAGCITAGEALRLMQSGLARLVDVCTGPDPGRSQLESHLPSGALAVALPPSSSGSPVHDFGEALGALAAATETLLFIAGSAEDSHAAATLAARAGFYCALQVLDERERYLALRDAVMA
jgi:hypothetical protein